MERQPLPMAADHERAVVGHLIDLWEENGQLLGLAQMVPGQDLFKSAMLA